MLLRKKTTLEWSLEFLSDLINNLLFLTFNLGIFYAMYWAYKQDQQVKTKTNQPKNNRH